MDDHEPVRRLCGMLAVRFVFVTGQSPRYTTEELAGLGAAVATKPLSADAFGAATA